MTKEEVGKQFGAMAHHLMHAHYVISHLVPHIDTEVDRLAAKHILTDLTWGAENCTVIGKHLNGLALDDNMGIDSENLAVAKQADIAFWWFKKKLSPQVQALIAQEYERGNHETKGTVRHHDGTGQTN